MFIGHYSASFAARGFKPALPLWHLFIAVQLVDFAWATLVLLGIEKVRIEPGLMEASMLDLHHMPYTHSLPASLLWGIGAGVVYALIFKGPSRVKAGVIFGCAVFSHWVLDLVVHGPDLLLYPGGAKVGFGLWNSLLWSQVLEIGLLIAGFAIYLIMTRPKGPIGRFAPFIFLAFMLGLQGYNHIPVEVPPDVPIFAVTALFGYTILSVAAWATDRTRMAV